jgi:hypothetical protein
MYEAVHQSVVMYDTLHLLVRFTFLLGVPFVLAVSAFRPRRMPWWLAVLLAAVLGWLGLTVGAYLGNKGVEAWIEEQALPKGPWGHEDHSRPFVDPWPPYFPVPFWWGCIVGIGYLMLLFGPWRLSRVVIRRARMDPLFLMRLRLGILSACLGLAIVCALVFFSAR